MDSKYEMFNKGNDRRDIVSFVKEIEKYPCLYNKTIPEYANKVHNRRAWSTIAKKINTTVPDCRDKWRKIRISYMRSLKQQQSDKPPMRPYYLSDELQFLRPFLTINPKTIQKEEYTMDVEHSSIKKQENSDSDASDPFDIEIAEDEPEVERISINNTHSIRETPQEVFHIKQNERNHFSPEKAYVIKSYNIENKFERQSYGEEKHNESKFDRHSYGEEKHNENKFDRHSYGEEKHKENKFDRYSYGEEKHNENKFDRHGYGEEKPHIRIYGEEKEADARRMFLLSLLPDVNCFTETEMRIFRRDVIGACDKIMDKRMIRNY